MEHFPVKNELWNLSSILLDIPFSKWRKPAPYTLWLYTTLKIFTRQCSWKFAEAKFYSNIAMPFFTLFHQLGSWAQKASGSGQKREKSSISRFAMCQLTKRACIDLNSRRIVGKSHHLSSSLSANTIKRF